MPIATSASSPRHYFAGAVPGLTPVCCYWFNEMQTSQSFFFFPFYLNDNCCSQTHTFFVTLHQDNPPKPQQTWCFLLPPAGTSILHSRQWGQLPARQPVQTARWSGRRHSRSFSIQTQLALWHGQITLFFCSRLFICFCRNFVKNDVYSKYNFVFWGRCPVWFNSLYVINWWSD